MAVTNVSMALAYSPALASCTALDMALLETVLFLCKISSNSASLMLGAGGSLCRSGGLLNGSEGDVNVADGGLPYGSVDVWLGANPGVLLGGAPGVGACEAGGKNAGFT